MSRLPSGYTQLEYIQSSGAQYINTGVVPNGDSRIVMDCKPMDVSATFCFFCARTEVNATDATANVAFYVDGVYRRDFYGESKSTSGAYGAGNRLQLDANKNAVSFGADYSLSFTASAKASPMPFILMASAVPGSTAMTFVNVSNYAKMRLYACQIYDGETLVRNFISCKNSSGAIGLYDTVGAAFYANAGSGAFTAGPEIIPDPPAAPTDLQTALAIALRWTAVNGADHYNVYRDGTKIGSAPVAQYIDLTAEENQTYTYSVTAENSGGESAAASLTVYTKTGYFQYKPVIESANFT